MGGSSRCAELDAIRISALVEQGGPTDDEVADHNGVTPSERREREREELVQRVRDEKSREYAEGVGKERESPAPMSTEEPWTVRGRNQAFQPGIGL